MTLITFTKVDSGIVAADVREIVSAPIRIRESQNVNVVSNATRHIRDTQDRLCTFKSCSVHWTILVAFRLVINSMDCYWTATV